MSKIVIFLLFLISPSFYQSHAQVIYYSEDISQLDSSFTIGRKLMVNTHIKEKDTSYTIDTFWDGRNSVEVYICNVKFIDSVFQKYFPEFGYAESAYLESLRTQDYNYFFYPFSNDFIDRYLEDRVGDSVLVVWPGGRFYANIDYIGIGDTPANYGYYCILKPLEEIILPPTTDDILLVFRHNHFYSGPVCGFRKIMPYDNEYSDMTCKVIMEFE
jgi:hypothetical protein